MFGPCPQAFHEVDVASPEKVTWKTWNTCSMLERDVRLVGLWERASINLENARSKKGSEPEPQEYVFFLFFFVVCLGFFFCRKKNRFARVESFDLTELRDPTI